MDRTYYDGYKKTLKKECPRGQQGCGGFWKWNNKYLNGIACCDIAGGVCIDDNEGFLKLEKQFE